MNVFVLLDLYLQSLAALNRSPRTIDWYDYQCRRFFHWLEANNLHNGNWLRAEIIEQYLAASRTTNAPATVAGHYRALRGWFTWLVERNYLNASPMQTMKPPHVPRSEPNRTAVDEYLHLLHSIPTVDWIDNRDRLIVQTLFLCGLRLGECAGLTAADYRIADHLLRVNGKTGVRLVPLLPPVERAFVAYRFTRPDTPEPRLFLASDRGRSGPHVAIQDKGIYQMLRRRCQQAGLRRLNPHSFRHGLAMHLLNTGGDMSLVQKILGHSQIATTARHYADWLTEGLVSEFAEKMKGLGT